jgi:hypothetical protein
MFDAQLITNDAGLGVPTIVYTPWFPRGGDHGIFALEAAAWSNSSASTILKLEVYHKSRDESGDGTLAGTSGTDKIEMASNGGVGRSMRDWGSVTFKELIRFKLSFDAGSGAQWAIFRVLPPMSYDAVKA